MCSCPTIVHTCRSPLHSLHLGLDAPERLRGIHINESSFAFDWNLDCGFAVAANKVARADVAFNGHQIGKKAARPEHRIAAFALERGHHHKSAALGIESCDQTVDEAYIDAGHIAETYKDGVGLRRYRCNSGFQRGAETRCKIRIVNEAHRQA